MYIFLDAPKVLVIWQEKCKNYNEPKAKIENGKVPISRSTILSTGLYKADGIGSMEKSNYRKTYSPGEHKL